MRRLALSLSCLLPLLTISARAESFTDYARVRHVEPRYETVQVPQRECGSSWITEGGSATAPNYGGVAIGAIAGGLIGNQVGRGRGREAATAVGAVVGALAGDRIAARGAVYEQPYQREVRSCRDVMVPQARLVGYHVVYEYRGQQYSTFTPDEPGATMPVRISIAPESGYHAEQRYQREYRY